MSLEPKVNVNTSTDLHLDLLADPTKIKPQKKNISLTHISESDDEKDNHVVERLDNRKILSDSSRKSSKSSKSSRSSKSSENSLSSSSHSKKNINFISSKPINLPILQEKQPDNIPKPTPGFFANLFGGGGFSNQTAQPAQPAQPLPPPLPPVQNTNTPPQYSFPTNQEKDNYNTLPDEQKRLKRLQKFAELKYVKDTYKVILTKEFSYNSDYHEMCAEIEFHRANISKKLSVEFFKSMVFGSVGMVDKLNKMFDPFGLKETLDGFPEHLQMTTGDSEIYEELAEKYKGKFKEYSVEMRFMLLLVGSAAGFIASKKAAESIPFFNNLDEKTKQDIVKNLTKNIQAGIVPATAEQRNKEEQNRILQYMMQQKKQEEEKNQRMQNLVSQNIQQKVFENMSNNSAKIDKSILITSSVDSDDSTINISTNNS
jgi:hypothetical protein